MLFLLDNFCLFISICCCLIIKSYSNLYDPMDYSLPSSYIHGISQTRILADLYCLSHRGQSCPMTEPLSHQGNTFISLSVKSPKPLFRDFLVCFLNSFSSQLKNIKHTHTHTHTHIHTQCQRKILKGWIYPPLSRILVPQVLTASITLHLNFDPYCTVTCSEVLLGSSLATALCWILNLPAKAKNW